MAKLKVFTWSDGFHAYTVAATSRAKALAAWGVTRDLFKDGEASELSTGADHDAALSRPGETVSRGLSVDVGKVSSVKKPKARNQADLARVTKLKRDLADLAAAHQCDVAKLEDRRARLEEEAAELDRDFRARSAGASKALEAARRRRS